MHTGKAFWLAAFIGMDFDSISAGVLELGLCRTLLCPGLRTMT